jgi:ATP-dependent DNA helicase RecG
LREALLNAVVHKDYSSGNPVQISVYDNKIIFWNAGKLPDQLTIDMLQTKHPSIPYNPLIASAFFRAGYIETWGRGIEKINNECSMAEVPLPEFNYQYAGLMITFFAGSISNSMETPEEIKEESIEKTREKTREKTKKTVEKTKKTVEKTKKTREKTVEKTKETREKTEKTREKIINAIKESPEISTTELSKQLNLTRRGIEWQINNLKESGRIIRIGPDKGGYWEVIGE